MRRYSFSLVSAALFAACSGSPEGEGPKAAPPDFDLDAAESRGFPGYERAQAPDATPRVEFNAMRGFVALPFRGFRGQRVDIRLNGSTDAFLFLYGPKTDGRWGRPLARNDDAEGRNARITQQLPTSGEYVVLATTYGDAAAQRAVDTGTLTLAADLGWSTAPELGSGDHTAGSVTVANAVEGLRRPTGLAFNPHQPGQMWATNQDTDSITVVTTTEATPMANTSLLRDRSAHFLIYPTSLSFAPDEPLFATCQESANDYRGLSGMPANNFMGPVIYPSEMSRLNASDISRSHLDMLHHSPFCMGVLMTAGREVWAFNGQAGAIDRYRYNEFHAPGADDHRDGQTWRYAAGELMRVASVPSGLALDTDARQLYVADTGHGRIVRLSAPADPPEDATRLTAHTTETRLLAAPDSHVEEVVGSAGELRRPSGLALHRGRLFVADNMTGRISAFDLEGRRLNWLDTGLPAGSLTNLAVSPDGRIYVSDRMGQRVLRIDP